MLPKAGLWALPIELVLRIYETLCGGLKSLYRSVSGARILTLSSVRQTSLCEQCNEIHLEQLFAHLKGGQSSRVFTLRRTAAHMHTTQCSLCRLVRDDPYFASIRETRADISEYRWRVWAEPGVSSCRFGIDIEDQIYTNELRVDLDVRETYEGAIKYDHVGCQRSYDVVNKIVPEKRNTYSSAAVRHPLPACFEASNVERWTSTCQRFHRAEGQRRRISLQPLLSQGLFRLVDVSAGVVETIRSRDVRYFALSYMWGCSVANPMATQRRHEHQSRCKTRASDKHWVLDWSKVPKTVKDAAVLLRSMGERYLWVDALCIDQSDAAERQSIIAEMSAIYESASLTIIAANGNSADAGLTRLHVDESVIEHLSNVRFADGTLSILPRRESLDAALLACGWSKRAWTYQERALSAHTLIFTDDEVHFQCSHHEELTFCETMDFEIYDSHPKWATAMTPHDDTRKIREWGRRQLYLREALCRDTELTFGLWTKAVLDHCDRELSHAGDRLDAFAGIAQRFTPTGSSRSLAATLSGLPARWFWHALSWKSYDGNIFPKTASHRIWRNASRTRSYPSWSWAGWSGMINIRLDHGTTAFEVTLADTANIIVAPRGKDLYWNPWPFKPQACMPESNGAVTVHLWAKCIPGYCILNQDARSMELFVPLSIMRCDAPAMFAIDQLTEAQEASMLSEMRQHGRNHPGWITSDGFELDEASPAAKGLLDVRLEMIIFRTHDDPLSPEEYRAVPVTRREPSSLQVERVFPFAFTIFRHDMVKFRPFVRDQYIQLQ